VVDFRVDFVIASTISPRARQSCEKTRVDTMASSMGGLLRLRGMSHQISRPSGRRLPKADYPLQDLTGGIIEAFIHVHRELGYGFLESPYRKALAVELRRRGLSIEQLVRYELVYCGVPIGVYEADLVVEQLVIVETKTGLVLDPVAQAQVLNYLKASHLEVGLVLHFGPRPVVKRVVRSRYYSRLGTARSSDETSIPIGAPSDDLKQDERADCRHNRER
jgi:GxxExxY protein